MSVNNQHVVVWEFLVVAGREADFEDTYGPRGEWAQLFAASNDFLGTELLRNSLQPSRYVTLDRWTSEAGFSRFHEAHAAAYAALDAECERLTESEIARDTWTPVPSQTAGRER